MPRRWPDRRSLCLASLLAAPSAPAAEPRVLTLIPDDPALIVFATTSLERIDSRLRDFLRAAEGPTLPPLINILDTMGLRPGVDMARSAAIVLDTSDPAEPRAVILLPVSNLEAFLDAVGALPADDDYTFDYAGVSYHLRRAGRAYVAISSHRPALDRIASDGVSLDSYSPLARRCLQDADAALRFRPARLDALLDAAGPLLLTTLPLPPRTDFIQSLRGQLRREDNTPLAAVFPGRLARIALDEAADCLLAATFDTTGLRLDLVITFTPQSLCAKACTVGTGRADPFTLLPDQPFFAAVGVDAAHPGVRLLADDLSPPGRATGWLTEAERAALTSARSMDAAAIALYEPPSFLLGVASRALIAWRAPMPEEGVNAFAEWVQSLNGRPLGTASLTTTWTPIADNTPRRVFRWTITPPAGTLSALPMLFGPFADIQGRAAFTADRAYLTPSRDAALFDACLNMGDPAGAAPLASNERVRFAASQLPGPRLLEACFDPSTLLTQAARMIPDHDPDEDLPDRLPLIAVGVTAHAGAARITILLPTAVLRALNAFMPQRHAAVQPEADP